MNINLNNYEECELRQAQIFVMNNATYSIAGDTASKSTDFIELRVEFDRWIKIYNQDLKLFNIKPMKKKTMVPIEFVGEVIEICYNEVQDMTSSIMKFDNVIKAPKDLNLKNMKFKCVQIIEEDEI